MARKLKVKAVQIWLGNRLKEPHKKKKKQKMKMKKMEHKTRLVHVNQVSRLVDRPTN